MAGSKSKAAIPTAPARPEQRAVKDPEATAAIKRAIALTQPGRTSSGATAATSSTFEVDPGSNGTVTVRRTSEPKGEGRFRIRALADYAIRRQPADDLRRELAAMSKKLMLSSAAPSSTVRPAAEGGPTHEQFVAKLNAPRAAVIASRMGRTLNRQCDDAMPPRSTVRQQVQQTDPTVPPEGVAARAPAAGRRVLGPDPSGPDAPRPAGSRPHDGHLDYLMTAKNANTNDPTKWIRATPTRPARTTRASSPCGRCSC